MEKEQTLVWRALTQRHDPSTFLLEQAAMDFLNKICQCCALFIEMGGLVARDAEMVKDDSFDTMHFGRYLSAHVAVYPPASVDLEVLQPSLALLECRES